MTTLQSDLTAVLSVDDLAQEIRRVDGNNDLGAGALAEAILPFFLRRHADALRGCVVVPRKLTNEMIDACHNVPSGIAGSPPHPQWIWDAMLAAAQEGCRNG